MPECYRKPRFRANKSNLTPRMFKTVTNSGSMTDATSKASKRSEKPSMSRPTSDRLTPGTTSDAAERETMTPVPFLCTLH